MFKETKESWTEAATATSVGLPWLLIGIVLLLLIGIVFSVMSWWSWAYFAPKTAAVQSQVFHESQQYNDGMVRDLENLRMEYQRASPEQRDALRATIAHRFAGYPQDKLTPELRSFYESLRR